MQEFEVESPQDRDKMDQNFLDMPLLGSPSAGDRPLKAACTFKPELELLNL